METLKNLCKKYYKNGWPDRDTVHSYIDYYEVILKPYRETAKNVLEVGLMSGESLRMWTEYFSGTVYGMDCDIRPHGGLADLTQIIGEGFKVMIGDAENPHDVEKYFNGIKFDIVIEDAGHHIPQQLKIYKTLKPYLNKGAIYIIEDVQDIDATRELFEKMDDEKEITIADRRFIRPRYDDVLIIIKDK